jgi:hypothetical protein
MASLQQSEMVVQGLPSAAQQVPVVQVRTVVPPWQQSALVVHRPWAAAQHLPAVQVSVASQHVCPGVQVEPLAAQALHMPAEHVSMAQHSSVLVHVMFGPLHIVVPVVVVAPPTPVPPEPPAPVVVITPCTMVVVLLPIWSRLGPPGSPGPGGSRVVTVEPDEQLAIIVNSQKKAAALRMCGLRQK